MFCVANGIEGLGTCKINNMVLSKSWTLLCILNGVKEKNENGEINEYPENNWNRPRSKEIKEKG